MASTFYGANFLWPAPIYFMGRNCIATIVHPCVALFSILFTMVHIAHCFLIKCMLNNAAAQGAMAYKSATQRCFIEILKPAIKKYYSFLEASVKPMVVPISVLLRTWMVCPCASMICLQIARPRPVPPT